MTASQRGQQGTWRFLGWWRGEDIDLDATRAQLPANDQDAALLIASERPGELHHVPTMGRAGTWYIWDGRCHRPDTSAMAERLIMDYADRAQALLLRCHQETSARIAVQLGPAATPQDVERGVKVAWKPWEACVKYHAALKKTAGSRSLLAKLADLRGVPEQHMADRWPEHLNCANGIVNLRTGELLPHDPRAMMTYCLDTAYVPGARGHGWEALVWNVAGKVPDVAAYLQRMLGYSCLGDNREQLIFFMYGKTGSGKSQVVEAVAGVLGPLAHSSGSELISRSRNERHARVENSITGVRFVYIDESAERVHIDEGQLKKITGAGRISINRLYAPVEIETKVTWSIWQPTNEMPTIPGFDAAIRRRARVIPCGDPIPDALQEKKLGERLAREEAEGILAFLVAGAMDYFAGGEHKPAECELATATYEQEQNTVWMFWETCCQQIPGYVNPNGHAPVATTQAQTRIEYLAFCKDMKLAYESSHPFHEKFRALPGIIWDDKSKRYLGLTIVRRESPLGDHGDIYKTWKGE